MKKRYYPTDVEYNRQTQTLTWVYAGKEYACTGDFFVDKRGYLYHYFFTPYGREKRIRHKIY